MAKNISELIQELIGKRTYEQLAKDCGGVPSKARLYTFVRDPIKNFPAPDSIQGLAKGLGVTEFDIVQACAVSIGLWSEKNKQPGISLPEGSETLTQTQKTFVVGLVREFMAANQGH